MIPICHYLYNLTLTETRFLNRLASSLAAVILTLAKMILCSFASNDPEESTSVYDTNLFTLIDFKSILNDLWLVFYNSIVQKESFKVMLISNIINKLVRAFIFLFIYYFY